MKHLFKLSFAAFIMLTVACDPLGDTYDELDESNPGLVLDLEYTLSDDDYDLVDKSFGNFNSEEEAKELVPVVLKSKYPYLGQGSSALVTYAIYDPIRVNEDVYYEFEAEDYEALGESFPNFSSLGDLYRAAAYVIPDASEGDVVTMEYDYYDGSVSTRQSTMAFYGTQWYVSYVPTIEDYYAMGQSYANFESRSTARARIQNILNTSEYAYGEEGDFRTSVFEYTYVDDDDVRHYENFLVVYEHDGEKWVAIDDVIESSLTYGLDAGVWVPDNTIKYTFASEDYTWVVSNFADSNPAGATNLGTYGNFSCYEWSDEQIFAALTGRLEAVYGTPEEGQKYQVTYSQYCGATTFPVLYVIYEDGAYAEQ